MKQSDVRFGNAQKTTDPLTASPNSQRAGLLSLTLPNHVWCQYDPSGQDHPKTIN
jgi:hypothetical protein